MKLYSTNNKRSRISFRDAVFNSMPSDGGLYLPVEIPKLDADFIKNLSQYSLQEIALNITSALLLDDIPTTDLKKMLKEALPFEAPLHSIDEKLSVLELFHGPSLAFKDFGARFMSRIMSYYWHPGEQEVDLLVATSGDTGGAVALGFLGVLGIRVTILFPKGGVSPLQELQLTSNGQNIRALEVEGTFDDCQALVKQAFIDPDLNRVLKLSSANSINIARLIPQMFYYFDAVAKQQRRGDEEVVFVVPSGNFGNLGAGVFAYKMGLPVKHFIAATNANDTVPRYLETSVYEARPSVKTLANAMDVGAPNNWVRIMEFFEGDLELLRSVVKAYSFNDAQTLNGIKELFDHSAYIVCPHTSIAYLAAKQYRKDFPGDYQTIVLSTAHPCKFHDIFPASIASKIEVPERLNELKLKKGQAIRMAADFHMLKKILLAAH